MLQLKNCILLKFSGDKEFINTLYKEALLMLELRHPHIISFFGISVDEENSEILMLMELMSCSLRDLFKNKVNLNSKEKVKILMGIAQGMSYLHSLKPPILHLDLKCTNILVRKDEGSYIIKITDFGISAAKISIKVKPSGMTPNYAAPETLFNKPVSEKTDVYSFGLIMWELFTYSVPFEGLSTEELKMQVAREIDPLRPPIPKNCPTEYTDLMKYCWQYSANDRPTFNDVLKGLSNIDCSKF